MNHNPQNLEIGETVILDENSEVIIKGFSPLKLYSFIKTVDYNVSWEVMTYRLSKINKNHVNN